MFSLRKHRKSQHCDSTQTRFICCRGLDSDASPRRFITLFIGSSDWQLQICGVKILLELLSSEKTPLSPEPLDTFSIGDSDVIVICTSRAETWLDFGLFVAQLWRRSSSELGKFPSQTKQAYGSLGRFFCPFSLWIFRPNWRGSDWWEVSWVLVWNIQ